MIWVLIGSAVIAIWVDPADGLKIGLVILAVVIIRGQQLHAEGRTPVIRPTANATA